jgi:hypothetical protein
MDDWISYVYGKARTFKAKRIHVIHHTGAHGQRYEVDRSNESLLKNLIQQGKVKIRNWMLRNSIDERILVQFDQDIFDPIYQHLDIPYELDSVSGRIVKKKKIFSDSQNLATEKVTTFTESVSIPNESKEIEANQGNMRTGGGKSKHRKRRKQHQTDNII